MRTPNPLRGLGASTKRGHMASNVVKGAVPVRSRMPLKAPKAPKIKAPKAPKSRAPKAPKSPKIEGLPLPGFPG